MADKENKRKYQMADSTLIQKSEDIISSMTRDAADFLAKRNVAPARMATLNTAQAAFAEFPTDEELQGDVTVRTEYKDAKRVALEEAIRSIRGMADTKFNGSGLYKTFAFNDLSGQTDPELVRMGKRVARVGTTLLSQLASEGLTAQMLTDLETLSADFFALIDGVDDAEETRDIKTQQRVTLGNALYDKVVEFANIGKAIYEDTDEAKYNDYVITDTPPPPPPPAA